MKASPSRETAGLWPVPVGQSDCTSFVLHFRVMAPGPGARLVLHPSPICHCGLGRWRWQPGAGLEGHGRSPGRDRPWPAWQRKVTATQGLAETIPTVAAPGDRGPYALGLPWCLSSVSPR